LSPHQARNLEDYLNCTIIDRTDLILDIFEKAAISAEGKTQVTIAKLQHEKTRLAGKGIHFSQQEGVVGLRGGPGEKAKERERRHIENQILQFKKQLVTIQKSRDVQRKQRLGRKIPQLCLIGYTNAGKSTILNALTKSDVLAEDKLFATLDTTTRALFLNGTQKGVISDTVGFIQQLPHQLIEAFKSTLSELQYADLLLHVIDISDANWQSHINVVHQILEELGIEKDMLYVFNKSDKATNIASLMPEIEQYQPHIIISATSKKGLDPLISYLNSWKPAK
jgi:GTP-binding protein HflX